MFEELKKNYLTTFEKKIVLFRSALKEKKRQNLIQYTHQLAGSSGSYGLLDIYLKAQELEELLLNHASTDKDIENTTNHLIQLMENQLIDSDKNSA